MDIQIDYQFIYVLILLFSGVIFDYLISNWRTLEPKEQHILDSIRELND